MRVVVQRVSRAVVRVGGDTIGSIGSGLLVLAAFSATDREEELTWMARKLTGLRVFPDDERRMNRSIREAAGSFLVVSQFTLYGDASRGMRPSFTGAAAPGRAEGLYDRFLEALRGQGVPVETGSFGAMMEVELINDGPVTLILDR
jgi:D-tyrosyl-tRNA(Tyr) deacylase